MGEGGWWDRIGGGGEVGGGVDAGCVYWSLGLMLVSDRSVALKS